MIMSSIHSPTLPPWCMSVRFVHDIIYAVIFTKDIEQVSHATTICKLTPTITHMLHHDYLRVLTVQNSDWSILQQIYVPEWDMTLQKLPINQRYKLVAMTLFQGDHYLIPAYVAYYHQKFGVEHFFLYYNGVLDTVTLPPLDLVTYVEWNHPYYIDDHVQYNRHCAQFGALNDFLHMAKHFVDYVLFNDLDEYIFWNRNDCSLSEFIYAQSKICYAFQMQYVALYDNTAYDDSVKMAKAIESKQFQVFPREYPLSPVGAHGGKCIVSVKDVHMMCVHNVNNPHYMDILGDTFIFPFTDAGYYHIYNFANRKNASGGPR